MSFNDRLGLRREGDAIVLDATAEHEIVPDTVHFAVLTTLGEVAAAGAVGAPVVPASVHVQLFRRARRGRLVGRGEVLKQGRRLAFAEGAVEQDGKPVAKVTVQFAVLG